MTSKAVLATILLVLLAASAIALAFHYDSVTRATIVEYQRDQGKGGAWKKTPLSKVMNFASHYGDWPELMGIGAMGLLVAWRLRSRDWLKIIAAAMIASTLAGILANTSRLTTGRPRPREVATLGNHWYGPYLAAIPGHEGKLLIGDSSYNSFPSGHTATAIGFAAVLLFARPLIGLFVMLPAFLISFSRMYLGAHHFSDIITSVVLGLFVAWLVWRWTKKHGDPFAQKILPG